MVADSHGRQATERATLRTRSSVVQLRRLAGFAGGACFPREAGKLSTGVVMRAPPGARR
jgi:hypothetical protein